MGKLTATKVKNAPPGKHGDGDGLYLVVSPSGARKWILRIQHNGKRRDIGLGSLKTVTLAEARDAAYELRRGAQKGIDPLVEKRRKSETIPTFKEAALQVIEEHKPTWKNQKHADQWTSTLEAYVFPTLGSLPVNEIDGPMIRDVLIEIWLDIPETARRVKQRIGTVLDFAYAKGWRDSEAPMRSLARGLPKQPKGKKHMPALAWKHLPNFIQNMATIIQASETVRLGIEFLILTVARSGEVRGARWGEFDLKEKVWTIPGERMKAGRPHRVPLSPRAIAILKKMETLRSNDKPDCLVFEGSKAGQPFSDMTFSMPLRRAELKITIHGFRSTFRDWCAEATDTPREVAEACLAHTVKNQAEAAYARSDHLEKRRKLMTKWATYCTSKVSS